MAVIDKTVKGKSIERLHVFMQQCGWYRGKDYDLSSLRSDCFLGIFFMIPVSKSHKPHVLAHRWFNDLLTRPQYEHKSVAKATRYANIGDRLRECEARSNLRNHIKFRINTQV